MKIQPIGFQGVFQHRMLSSNTPDDAQYNSVHVFLGHFLHCVLYIYNYTTIILFELPQHMNMIIIFHYCNMIHNITIMINSTMFIIHTYLDVFFFFLHLPLCVSNIYLFFNFPLRGSYVFSFISLLFICMRPEFPLNIRENCSNFSQQLFILQCFYFPLNILHLQQQTRKCSGSLKVSFGVKNRGDTRMPHKYKVQYNLFKIHPALLYGVCDMLFTNKNLNFKGSVFDLLFSFW